VLKNKQVARGLLKNKIALVLNLFRVNSSLKKTQAYKS